MKLIIGLIVAVLILIFGVQSCQNPVTDAVEGVADGVGDVAGAVKDMGEKGAEALGDAAAGLGKFFMKKLPNGVELNIPQSGVENKLISFVAGSQAVDKTTWFDFDRVTFDSGSANLSADSMEQIKNISEIMKAYPAMKAKIGGYTDNTGGAEINKSISQKRADSVRSALVGMGIADDRLEAEGYGDANPIASNDTPEGRAQNRRMSLRVNAK